MVSWGQGRVETFTLREEIADALALKQSLSSIYKKFSADAQITIGYEAFRENIRKLCAEGYLDSPSAPPAGPVIGPAGGAPSPLKTPAPTPPADHAGSRLLSISPSSSREGFGHQSEGATAEFLDAVYGLAPTTPDKKESIND